MHGHIGHICEHFMHTFAHICKISLFFRFLLFIFANLRSDQRRSFFLNKQKLEYKELFWKAIEGNSNSVKSYLFVVINSGNPSIFHANFQTVLFRPYTVGRQRLAFMLLEQHFPVSFFFRPTFFLFCKLNWTTFQSYSGIIRTVPIYC